MALNFMDCKHTRGLQKFTKEPLESTKTSETDLSSVQQLEEPQQPQEPQEPQEPQQPQQLQEPQQQKPLNPLELLRKELKNPPCYLPKRADNMPGIDLLNIKMGPIGPWATGKVDWTPSAGLTGVRPVVTSYSVTRFSPSEWRDKNYAVMKDVAQVFSDAAGTAEHALTVADEMKHKVQNMQEQSNVDIKNRIFVVKLWKDKLESAIRSMADEICTMEEERIRLKESLVMFGIPESIARECLSMRSRRADTELIRDEPEIELVNELALIAEVRRLMNLKVEEFEQQQIENRNARERLEGDWSDKTEGWHLDRINAKLNNDNPTILWRPGAMRPKPGQASGKYWDHFSTEIYNEGQQTLKNSINLRSNLTELLNNAVSQLMNQADKVLDAFNHHIECTHEHLDRLECELEQCLQTLADTENRIEYLKETIRSFDASMKVAQSRMHNRSYRPNVENCRDKAQQNLIDEVALNKTSVAAIQAEVDNSEAVKTKLITLRNSLEREIKLNRRTLFIDEDRCLELRSHFPNLREKI